MCWEKPGIKVLVWESSIHWWQLAGHSGDLGNEGSKERSENQKDLDLDGAFLLLQACVLVKRKPWVPVVVKAASRNTWGFLPGPSFTATSLSTTQNKGSKWATWGPEKVPSYASGRSTMSWKLNTTFNYLGISFFKNISSWFFWKVIRSASTEPTFCGSNSLWSQHCPLEGQALPNSLRSPALLISPQS